MSKKVIYFLYANFAYKKSAMIVAFNINDQNTFDIEFKKIESAQHFKSLVNSENRVIQAFFFCCGGKLLNACLDVLNALSVRSLTISLFPGVVLKSQIEAFLTRLRVDLILLNSPADFFYYKKLCRMLGVRFNGFLYGPSWIKCIEFSEKSNAKDAIFYEQFYVPKSLKDKVYLLDCLVRIARNNQQQKIYIKSRPSEGFKGVVLSRLMDRYDDLPDNLINLRNDHDILLNDVGALLAVSSSTVFEAIYHRKDIYLIKEFSSKKNLVDVFKGSGCFHDSDKISLNEPSPINRDWLRDNYISPEITRNQLKNFILLNERSDEYKGYHFFRLFLLLPLIFLHCGWKMRRAIVMILISDHILHKRWR